MIVNRLGAGDYAPVLLVDNRLTIGQEVIDLDARQSDSQEIITVMDGEAYVAVVEIPPRSYHSEPLAEAEESETAAAQMVADDLDTEAVRVTLWPVIDKEGE